MLLNPGYYHWLYYKQKRHFWFNLAIGILYWLYIGMSLPFGVSTLTNTNFFTLVFILFPFVLIWPAISYTVDGAFTVLRVFEKRINTQTYWSLSIKIFLFVHVILIARGVLCYWKCINLQIYGLIWLESLVLLLVVFLPFNLIARKIFVKKRQLLDGNNLDNLFEIVGELKKTVRLDLTRVMYIKSDDKYVEFYLANKDSEPEKLLFRASLKTIQSQLKGEQDFVRIHRSYIINFRYVLSYTRESQIEIGIRNFALPLPVSKSYRKNLPEIKI